MMTLSNIDEDKLKIIFIVILSFSLISIMYFISEDMKNEMYSFKNYRFVTILNLDHEIVELFS